VSRVRPLAEGLWAVDGPERVAGLGIGTRMTVVRLGDGRLWLHSPVPHGPDLDADLEALGPVGFLVAPSKVHHLWLGPWSEAHPEATVWGAPGLRDKRRDLIFHRELGDAPPPDWEADLDQALLTGAPYVNEVVFLHRASGTLLLTDFAMHFPKPLPDLWTRLWARAMGLAGGRLAVSRLVRTLVRDRAALEPALARVLAWPFDRVIVTHGGIVETGGAAELRAAWRPLLGD
jgi:hypothetical protein